MQKRRSTRPTGGAPSRRATTRSTASTPRSVTKRITSLQSSIWEADYVTVPKAGERAALDVPRHELPRLIEHLRSEMREAARALEFERAAELRDRIKTLEAERIKLT
jgi:excinuclease ABC subunit B